MLKPDQASGLQRFSANGGHFYHRNAIMMIRIARDMENVSSAAGDLFSFSGLVEEICLSVISPAKSVS